MNEPFISCSFVHVSTWGNDRVKIGKRGSIVHNLKSARARSAAVHGKGRGGGFGGRQVGGDAMRRPAPETMTGAKSDDGAEPRRTDGPTTGGGYAHGTAAEGKKAAPTIWSKPPCQRICLGESMLSPAGTPSLRNTRLAELLAAARALPRKPYSSSSSSRASSPEPMST